MSYHSFSVPWGRSSAYWRKKRSGASRRKSDYGVDDVYDLDNPRSWATGEQDTHGGWFIGDVAQYYRDKPVYDMLQANLRRAPGGRNGYPYAKFRAERPWDPTDHYRRFPAGYRRKFGFKATARKFARSWPKRSGRQLSSTLSDVAKNFNFQENYPVSVYRNPKFVPTYIS